MKQEGSASVKHLKIKPSPIVIVKSFLVLQIGALFVYFVAGSLTHYAQIYRALKIADAISFQIAQALFILVAEVILVFYIFFRWHREFYEIRADKIIHAKGIFHRYRTVIPLDRVSSVVYHQNLLGKLVQYGTIELKDGLTKNVAHFKHIPDPQSYVDLIIKVKRQDHPIRIVEFNNNQPDWRTLLETEENENLEFKSTFRWDLRNKKVNRNLEKAVMKTMAAFLNSGGGQLVLGVDDSKTIVGLNEDFATLGKENADGFENHFSHVFRNMLGAEFRQFVHLCWIKAQGKECCIVQVSPASQPVYLRTEDHEEFYIRAGNGTTSLKFSEANAYIESRFRSELA